MEYSDYIVFVDESGDHSLTSIDPEFPAFSLAFCVIKKKDYCEKIIPAVQGLKFKYWGHDSIVLHEHEIRKTKGDFAFLRTVTCPGIFPPDAIRVRPNLRTDNEANEIHGRTDHRHPGRA